MSQKINFFKQVSRLQNSDRLLFVQFKTKSKQILIWCFKSSCYSTLLHSKSQCSELRVSVMQGWHKACVNPVYIMCF